MKRPYLIASIALVGVTISLVAWFSLRHRGAAPESQSACGNTAPSYWYDPMHAAEHFNKPGKSPFMDMQLVPKCASRAGLSNSTSGRWAIRCAAAKSLPVFTPRRY